jgi:spermidine synthase
MYQAMGDAGFSHVNNLYFPQCAYPSGWWTVTMAGKTNSPVHFRETDASNKLFATKYYNTDIHSASLAMPEFVRQALTSSG